MEPRHSDVRRQKARTIESAYTDSTGQLVVHFTAKLSGREKNAPMYIRLHADSLLQALGDTSTLPPPLRPYRAQPSSRTFGKSYEHGAIVYIADSIMQRGLRNVSGADTLRGAVGVPGPAAGLVPASNIALEYIAVNGKHLLIVVPAPNKTRWWRYAVAPFAFAGDIATFPVQLVIALIALSNDKIPLS
ncbi:hypothetical protein ACWKWU_20660 [Chitinophaga lutea]